MVLPMQACDRMAGDCIDCLQTFVYGPYCNASCSRGCMNSDCSMLGEYRIGCSGGYTGARCETDFNSLYEELDKTQSVASQDRQQYEMLQASPNPVDNQQQVNERRDYDNEYHNENNCFQ
ncbi:hypothetical protein MAR_031904 [Mya arenaria]|uniref:Uncharacterized protein n=1 Tax=Mya arenaria TaxID=6604 RepID=A0ABY7F581_MYAAR|nr:hypothetical protein MAR_031904 [Mya arenaria]